MATKYGQEAIAYWARQTAATKMKFKVIGVIVVGAVIYAAAINLS